MIGRLLLICRLLVRDLRRRPAETVLLLIAVAAATGTLTVGLALNEMVADPYRQTRAATAGPDVTAEPGTTGEEALTALAPLPATPGVTAHSGPFPVAYLALTTRGTTVRAVVEGRDSAPAPVDQPAVTGGTWVRPGGVVIERTFAEALGLRPGDTVGVGGHPLPVTGIAVTAARPVFPSAGWHTPGGAEVEKGGLIWVDRGDLATLAGKQPPSYVLKLRLADPRSAAAFAEASTGGPGYRGGHVRTWQEIAGTNDQLTGAAAETLRVGSWLLAVLATAGIAGIVAGRVIARRRRVGLLKAVGAGPGLIAAVNLAEYLVPGLAGAAAGLTTGWLAAPRLFRPSAGFIGTVGAGPPAHVVAVVTAAAIAIAAAASLAPAIRAATTSTTDALADTATPPRRSGWRVRLSRRLPTALLIGVRINARRPHRARLVTVNTLITTAALAAVLTNLAQADDPLKLGGSTLPDARNERQLQAMFLVAAVACVLALLNTVVSTWTAVLDTRRPLAVARALGATPAQAGAGLAVAQLLPAVPGVVLGIPFGAQLYLFFDGDRHAPASWLLTAAFGVLLAVAALTAVPALAAARRPVADVLRSTPA